MNAAICTLALCFAPAPAAPAKPEAARQQRSETVVAFVRANLVVSLVDCRGWRKGYCLVHLRDGGELVAKGTAAQVVEQMAKPAIWIKLAVLPDEDAGDAP